MTRTLLILRHAKAEAADAAGDDFARGLTRRGARDAQRVGRDMLERDWIPGLILCSPARRTRDTAQAILQALDMPPDAAIQYDERLYNASPETLMQVLSGCPARVKRLLLIGHNPGLEGLVEYLAAEPPARKSNGKLLPTSALACLESDATWRALGQGGARLIDLLRR